MDLPEELIYSIADRLDDVGDRGRLGMVNRQMRAHMTAFPWGRRHYPGYVLHQLPAADTPGAWREIIAQRRLLNAAPAGGPGDPEAGRSGLATRVKWHADAGRYLHALACLPQDEPSYVPHLDLHIGRCLTALSRGGEAARFVGRAQQQSELIRFVVDNDVEGLRRQLAAGLEFERDMLTMVVESWPGYPPPWVWMTDAWQELTVHFARRKDFACLDYLVTQRRAPLEVRLAALHHLPRLLPEALDQALLGNAQDSALAAATLSHPSLAQDHGSMAAALRRDLLGPGRIPRARMLAEGGRAEVFRALAVDASPPLLYEIMGRRRHRHLRHAPTHRRVELLLSMYQQAGMTGRVFDLFHRGWAGGMFIAPEAFTLRRRCFAAFVSAGCRLTVEEFFDRTPQALTFRARYMRAAYLSEMTPHGRDNIYHILKTLLSMQAIELGGGFGPHLRLHAPNGPLLPAAEIHRLADLLSNSSHSDHAPKQASPT